LVALAKKQVQNQNEYKIVPTCCPNTPDKEVGLPAESDT